MWLALGQSNAANHAEVRQSAGTEVAAFDGRGCIAAGDPLPGGDGSAGSLWTPLAQAWVRQGGSERVLIAVTAKSATSVAEWVPGEPLHRRAERTIEALQRRGLRVSRILWIQGEADAILATPGLSYRKALERALAPLHRRSGAPVWIARASRCGEASSAAVRAAQERLIEARSWAVPGPDLDLIGPEERYQRCHFARQGQERAVKLWLASLKGTRS